MRIPALAVITLLAASAADAQKLEPRTNEPLTIHFVNAPFMDAMGFVGRQAGITVEMDETATAERRNAKLTLIMKDATLEEVLDTLTRLAGLSYMVVDPQTIRVYQLP